jgi:DNA-binding transcriptional ArsR family regulator
MARKRRNAADEIELMQCMSHITRREVLERLLAVGKPLSPSDLSEDLASPLGNISYHVRTLRERGVLKEVKRTPRRGAIEHHYDFHDAATREAVRRLIALTAVPA